MRYIIYGAGGIGGTIGARLHQSGKEVLLIARGDHLQSLKANGLELIDPNVAVTINIPCVGHPREIQFREDDVVLLCMKSQHTSAALDALFDSAGPAVRVVCCQNGVANERMALRKFEHVYAVPVILPSTHIQSGVVLHHCKNIGGVLDIGNFPNGADESAEAIAADFTAANFSARADSNVMRSKYAKLLQNLGNAMQALCKPGSESKTLYRLLVHEALACFDAAGIDCASREEVNQRSANLLEMAPIEGHERVGGSSLQSILRGTGSIVTDYLNGEIVLLGRLHGVPVPANSVLQLLANRLASSKGAPGSMDVKEVLQQIDSY